MTKTLINIFMVCHQFKIIVLDSAINRKSCKKNLLYSLSLKVKLIIHSSKTFKFHGKKVNITRKDDCCSHIKILFLPVFNILIFFLCILRTKMKKPKQKTTSKKGNATQKLMGNVPLQSIVERSGCLILFCCSLNLPIYDKTIATFW